MKISERLFTLMKAKKITQAELAEALGITQPSVGNWKTRGTTPPMEYLPTICEVLDISWEYLITGEEHTQHYTLDERRLIEQYRNTAPDGQTRIREYVCIMEREYAAYKEKPNAEAEAKIS